MVEFGIEMAMVVYVCVSVLIYEPRERERMKNVCIGVCLRCVCVFR
jgi:hypothetical protein